MLTSVENLARTALVVALAVFATACDDTGRLGPLAPSGSGTPSAGSAQAVHQEWSPYVGVHVTGEATAAYRDALVRLLQSGRLRGARVEINKRSIDAGAPVIKGIGALGVELLGLIGNDFVFDHPIEATIDRIFSTYPEIRYFQIGNEITTILPSSGPTMAVEQYMEVFQRIYAHVQNRYPGRAVLLTQSTLGSGQYGPRELEAMAALGLADMNPERVILAINDYDPHQAILYAGLLGTTLRRFRVWVTESGVPTPEQHASFVQSGYPLLRNYLRAERIYWYVLWGGDSGSDAGFSLISNPARYPDYSTSPLFQILTGSN
jgi:hypothetical protein